MHRERLLLTGCIGIFLPCNFFARTQDKYGGHRANGAVMYVLLVLQDRTWFCATVEFCQVVVRNFLFLLSFARTLFRNNWYLL